MTEQQMFWEEEEGRKVFSAFLESLRIDLAYHLVPEIHVLVLV